MTFIDNINESRISIFNKLINKSRLIFDKISDHRQKSNATKYSISDCCMGALSVFMLQDESFLSNQERLKKSHSYDNFSNLFGGMNIPTPNHIRKILDEISPNNFNEILDYGLDILKDENKLNDFEFLDNNYLVALDGVEYHSSQKIKCDCCNSRTHKTKTGGSTTYYHSMICGAIVHPDKSEVIPIRPEFISNIDGKEKQDCENAAAKRWIDKNADFYKNAGLKITILGDDLYSKEPICFKILEKEMNFILTCKPQSHKTMYEYINGADLKEKTIKERVKHKMTTYNYRYINNIPIKDGEKVLRVNWLEVIVSDPKDNRVLYKNCFATNHEINDNNVEKIAKAGRCRWKIENENNNILKTKGYNFEHNYGHGKKNLSADLAILTLAAFMFHTIALLLCDFYTKAAKTKGSRQRFYNTLKIITSYIIFDSWENLFLFVIDPPDNLKYSG
jgi:hypothetical protein